MRRLVLEASVASAALVWGGSAPAQVSGSLTATGTIAYSNTVNTALNTSATYTKNVAVRGGATVAGTFAIDSSAVAVVDSKQILTGNRVEFRQETSTDGQSGNVDAGIFGAGDAVVCPGNPAGPCDGNDIGDTTIDIASSRR